LRLIGLVVVITMLAMAAPATALDRFIELVPEEGTVGSEVVAVGEGFNKSTETTDKFAIIYFSSEEASSVDDIDSDVTVYEIVKDGLWLNEDGEFEVEFTVPAKLNDGEDDDDYEDVVAGTYYVYVCHYLNTDPPSVATRIRAVAEFTVIGGEIDIDPEEGPVGSEIEITGTEFADREDVTISYDDEEIDIESGDDGKFVSYCIPFFILNPDIGSTRRRLWHVERGNLKSAVIICPGIGNFIILEENGHITFRSKAVTTDLQDTPHRSCGGVYGNPGYHLKFNLIGIIFSILHYNGMSS
ncbi:unnamed protein product, partial [marine sediment metagenome]